MMVTEFITTLPDIPRLLTALAEWMACLVCILTLRRKLFGGKFAAVCAGALVLQTVFLVFTDRIEGVLWSICMTGAVFLMFLFISVCTDVSRNSAICCCSTAFVASEFVASAEWQLHCYLAGFLDTGDLRWQTALVLGMYGIIFVVIWRVEQKLYAGDDGFTISGKETAVIVVGTILIFAASNLGFLPIQIPFAGRDSAEIFSMRTLIDLGGLAMHYAYQAQWKSSNMQRELENIQTILNSQYEQYKQAQRTVDLINYRYHDLKNHIIALRADEDEKRHQYLDKLEKEIHSYEALNKTGNQVLDTLLTSKNLHCMQHKIDMTCVVDGSLFQSMDVMDICSIFGNALDNAIECEKKIKDYAKRMIHVDAFSEKSFLIIRFENYYEGDIRFDKGLPVTTKAQKALHGYGLKSLKYTVHKYNGEVHIDTEGNWFSLRILIPLDIASGKIPGMNKEK